MNDNSLLSTCRCCTHYQPEGRRGGTCSQLGVPVKGCWQACSLAARPFAPCWDGLDRRIARLETSLTLECSSPAASTPHLAPEPLEYEDITDRRYLTAS